MKRLSYFSVILLTLILGTIACKKKQSEPSPQERLLGKWKLTDFVWRQNGNIILQFNDVPDCFKDNYYEFRNNNVYVEDEGPTKCDSSDPQYKTGSYQLSPDGRKLTITIDGETTVADVLELSKTTLKIRAIINDGGMSFQVDATYSKM